MRRALSLLPLLAVAACATGPTLDQRLSAYVGKTELELVSMIGVPTRNYETAGQKFLQYEERRTVAFPSSFVGGGPYGGFYGRGFYGAGYAGFVDTYAPVQCDVTFNLQNGRVAGYSFRGQGCA